MPPIEINFDDLISRILSNVHTNRRATSLIMTFQRIIIYSHALRPAPGALAASPVSSTCGKQRLFVEEGAHEKIMKY